MKRNLIWISLLAFAAMTASEPAIAAESEGIFPLMAKKRKKAEPKDSVSESAYKRFTGRDSVALKGVAGIIKKDGSFYLEFPTRLLGREFLVTNRLQRVPSELNEAGVNKGINYENQVVTFEWLKVDKNSASANSASRRKSIPTTQWLHLWQTTISTLSSPA